MISEIWDPKTTDSTTISEIWDPKQPTVHQFQRVGSKNSRQYNNFMDLGPKTADRTTISKIWIQKEPTV